MSKMTTELILGLIFGVVIVLLFGAPYFQNKIGSLKLEYHTNSKSNADFLRELVEVINQLYEDSQYDNAELETHYQKQQNEFDELSEKYNELMDDYSMILCELPLTPDKTSTELIRKDYRWNYLGQQWELSITVPSSISDFYETHERIPTKDYSVYVTHPFDDEYLRSIIEKLNVIATQEDFTESEKVNFLISFVQSLPYSHDNVSTPYDEYPRFPIETLIFGGGDCEDTSILTAALLYELNYDVILINPPSHMAVGVNIESSGNYWTFEGIDYYYLETTDVGWFIGDCPKEYQVSAYLYGLTPMPVISHTWESSWNNGQLYISVSVENSGTTEAEGYQVWVAIDAGDRLVWSREESESFDLQFGREITLDLMLDVPRNEHTRLIVEILNQDGYYISQSFSEWFDT